MKYKRTYGDLAELLRGLGFSASRVSGSRLDFTGPDKALIILPDKPASDLVDVAYLTYVRRYLDECGLMEPDDFDAWRLQVQNSEQRKK